jgi:hypothetical protein
LSCVLHGSDCVVSMFWRMFTVSLLCCGILHCLAPSLLNGCICWFPSLCHPLVASCSTCCCCVIHRATFTPRVYSLVSSSCFVQCTGVPAFRHELHGTGECRRSSRLLCAHMSIIDVTCHMYLLSLICKCQSMWLDSCP